MVTIPPPWTPSGSQTRLRSAVVPDISAACSPRRLNTFIAGRWTVTTGHPLHFHLPSIHCYQVLSPRCPRGPVTPPRPSAPLTRPFRQHCLGEQCSHCNLKVAYCERGFTRGCRGDPDSVTQHQSHLPSHTNSHVVCGSQTLPPCYGVRSQRTSGTLIS